VHEGIGVGEEGILAAWGVGEPGGAEPNCFGSRIPGGSGGVSNTLLILLLILMSFIYFYIYSNIDTHIYMTARIYKYTHV
jgi:hypothetical protein